MPKSYNSFILYMTVECMKFLIILFALIVICSYSFRLDAEPLKLFNEPLFAHDSYSHFLSSAFIYCWQYETFKNTAHLGSGTSRIWAFSLTGFYGILKEIFDDKVKEQNFSYKDLACNFAGSLIMFVLWK